MAQKEHLTKENDKQNSETEKRIKEQIQVSNSEVSLKGSTPHKPFLPPQFSCWLQFQRVLLLFFTYSAIRCKIMIRTAVSNDDEDKKALQKSHKTVHGALYVIWRRERGPRFFKELQA